MRKVYGRENMKVVRKFNQQKRCVEYDVLFWDGVFSNRWHPVARLPTEMSKSRKTADFLYNQLLKPTILIDENKQDEE